MDPYVSLWGVGNSEMLLKSTSYPKVIMELWGW